MRYTEFKCNRCGHVKDAHNQKWGMKRWARFGLPREQLWGESLTDGHLCPWCASKFEKFMQMTLRDEDETEIERMPL